MPRIDPAVLRWARESAHLSEEEAAHKIGLRALRDRSASDRIRALEEGTAPVSRPLLLKLASAYRRPLISFYLAAPPPKADRGQDFRSLPREMIIENVGAVDALIRDVRARQGVVRALLVDEEAPRRAFVGSVAIDQGTESVAAAIQRTIGFELATFRKAKNVDLAFNYLRHLAERAGVFVLLIGNLGSHQSAIDAEVYRGFALADDIAPFVVVNDQDARSAWSFTLLHELAHIFLGQTGISGGLPDLRVERFCNDVAGSVLVPVRELKAIAGVENVDLDEAKRLISLFADERNVSRALVAYRLRLEGSLSEKRWARIRDDYRSEYLQFKAEQKDRASDSGPSYYVVRRHRVGQALLDLVRRTLDDGALTPTKAGKVLGVRPRNVEALITRGSP